MIKVTKKNNVALKLFCSFGLCFTTRAVDRKRDSDILFPAPKICTGQGAVVGYYIPQNAGLILTLPDF